MTDLAVAVSPSGAIRLGKDIVCDGFTSDASVRVQTHIHDDHMKQFNESKGYQDIYMSAASLALLAAEFNADIGVGMRENIHGVKYGEWLDVSAHRLKLLSSSHMLGAVQVCVQLQEGPCVGYSGDFGWPMDEVMEVEQLVRDSTNGCPRQTRRYSENEADEILVRRVRERLRFGSVHLIAHRGTVHRALETIGGEIDCPVLATKRRCAEIAVFREFGFPMPAVIDMNSEEGKAARGNSRCILLYSKGDKKPVDYGEDSSIVLSAYLACIIHEVGETAHDH